MGRAGGEEGGKDICMLAACADLSITFAYKINKIRSASDKSNQKDKQLHLNIIQNSHKKEQQAVQKQQC